VHAHPSGRRGPTTNPATTVRRFHGPLADQLFVLCRPSAGVANPARQAEAVYEALRDVLASEHVAPEAIVSETVFCRRIRDDVGPARSARSRVLGDAGLLPATTFIGQPPLADEADLELAAVAMVPRSPEASAYHVRHATGCACEACAAGVCARVVRLRDQTSLWVGNVYGSGRDAFAEAYDMFRVADDVLARAGMRFDDVMRTWIHVRDIDRDYDALNEARTKFFRDRRIERLPASTGVQGIPASDAHDFSLGLYALRSDRLLDIGVMSAPSLNEAWSYGADFSRGLRVADANNVALYVSGTASVDEAGRTANVGDFGAQVDRMLHNIASLLDRQGAGFEDVVSAVTYLKHASDAPALRSMFRARGFEGFPCALVHAPLCRPTLLCEAEVVAILSLGPAGA
jgi:enamine deaminase RidA (YjgF/YER057c/UK114 family)